MDSMDTVLSTDLGDVETDTMSPLATPSNEVSELEQEAVAMGSGGMENDEDDDMTGESSEVCVASLGDGSILVPTDGGQSIVGTTPDGVIGLFLQTSESGAVSLASGMKLSVSGMLPEGAVITTEPLQAIQAVTLSDGSTAYIQQPKEGKLEEGQAVTLEDGTTAVVQGPTTILPKIEPGEDGKGFEGATSIQLEDGTTAFFQPTAKGTLPEGLQAIQLEDGSTAYIAHPNPEALFGDGASGLDPVTLESLVQSQFGVGVKQQMTVEKALAIGEKAYKCGYEDCGRLYTTLHHLKVHERSHTGDRPFKCEVLSCGKAFATGYGLKSHTRVHTGEKPYPCPEETCDKAFKTSGDLQKHVRTHTGERPFKCPFEGCERSFTTSNIRKVHIRTHTGERPYTCTADHCHRSFASATNFKNHVRIHTGEKPYVCTVAGCGKRFTEYSSLYKHHVVHTHSKPYTCSYCGKNYRQTSTLAMHKRTAHGEGEECTAESEERIYIEKSGDSGVEPLRKKQRLQVTLPSVSEPSSSSLDDGEGTLVISTTDSQQVVMMKGDEDGQAIADLSQDGTEGFVTLGPTCTQLSIQGLQGQSLHGLTVGGEGGQQVFVVTDPAQLEVLQQLARQAQQQLNSVDGLDSSEDAVVTSGEGTLTTISTSNVVTTSSSLVVFQHE